MTIIRSYQGEYGTQGAFDARPILAKFKDFDFGLCKLDSLQLCVRHTSGQGIGGSYKFAASIALP